MTEPRGGASTPRSDGAPYAALDASFGAQAQAALQDVTVGLQQWRSWLYLAWNDVRNQYRRTVLGPWWLTLTTAVFVLGIALVFGRLQAIPMKEFLPYVAVGFVTFILLRDLIGSGATLLVGQASSILNTRQPLSAHVLRSVAVSSIQFLHNMAIVLVFFAIGYADVSLWLLLAPVVLLVLLANGVLVALWLGPVVARFRDMGPAVESVLGVSIFFTPVFYRAADLGDAEILVQLNPMTHFLVTFREVVLGVAPPTANVLSVVGFTVLNVVLAFAIFARARSRLPYWIS